MAFSILNPPLVKGQGIFRDLYRAANRGPIPEPTKLNVPGKAVRIQVGQIRAATWAGKPQWIVGANFHFGPLRLAADGATLEWKVPDAHCLFDEDVKELATSDYDKDDNGIFDSIDVPIILEFRMPLDQRLYGQTLTADLVMSVEYAGVEPQPYQPPVVSLKAAVMQTPVSVRVASVEEAKHYGSLTDSGAYHSIKFYGGLGLVLVFLLIMGRFLFGGRR